MISKSEMNEMTVYLEKEATIGWRKHIAQIAGVSQSTAWHALRALNSKGVNQKVAEAVRTMYKWYCPTMTVFEKSNKAFEENRPGYILGAIPTETVNTIGHQLMFFNSTKGPVIVQCMAHTDKYRIFLNEEGFNQK